ncbi:cytidine/deoxycytidylate deaminase-like protein [Glaciihabitans tibetensis]|uniref:Cytidine/deoxycytidylate deaminase-like protein n=1 Tax=Glaciihabitans tibetensis TaxID=1266600 RepID=A0A2T0V6Y9_9MICO|nr:nucleoside deaminase [Glaciihabitans tibetensis]PRY65943.1 cytidine/deoxycytidylate deaminase-like protein [Glaciihabitans tibetensis]
MNHSFPTSISAELPAWLEAELAELTAPLETHEQRMALVNELAARNYREGNGGPFAAIVVDRTTGLIVSVGVNIVLSSGLSAGHAEFTALSLAQTRLGGWDLGASPDQDLELVVNWRPCIMCYGSLIWSGVKHLVIAGDGEELEQLTGFDEGPIPGGDWRAELEARGISVTIDVLRDEAIAVFADYGASNSIVYNARGTGSRI